MNKMQIMRDSPAELTEGPPRPRSSLVALLSSVARRIFSDESTKGEELRWIVFVDSSFAPDDLYSCCWCLFSLHGWRLEMGELLTLSSVSDPSKMS